MALPTPDEILNRKKTGTLPSPSEILGKGVSSGLPSPSDILGTPVKTTTYKSPIQSRADLLGALDRFKSPTTPASSEPSKSSNVELFKDNPSRKLPVIGPVLRTLDKVADITKPVADVGVQLYTPGGSLANMAAFTKSVGQGLAKVAPKLGAGSGVGARATTEFIKEGALGVPLSAGLAAKEGLSDKDIIKAGLLGGAFGGAAGPLGPLGKSAYMELRYGDQLPLKEAVDEFIQRTKQPGNIAHPTERIVAQAGRAEAPAITKLSDANIPQQVATEGSLRSSSAARAVDTAEQAAVPSTPNEKMRGFAETLLESEKPPQSFKERLKSAYTPITNAEVVDLANARIAKDLSESHSFVMDKSKFTPEKVTTGHRLIDEYNKIGEYQKAVDIAEKLAEEGTKAGQTIQAFSIYDRLTPEGILVHAQRVAQRTNESIPLLAKEVKVTPDMAAQLTDLAQTSQKMTGVKDLSNDVMDILERAKVGEKLSEIEQQTIKQFVDDARQFVKETTRKTDPKPPKIHPDKRVRDNIVSFLEAQEEAAKERLRNRGIHVSSMPLDIYADYAIIGAAKMAKGTMKFADWSEAMVKELGESIRPYLKQLYERASETLTQSSKKVSETTVSRAEKIAERVIKNKGIEGEDAEFLRSMAQNVSGLSGDAKTIASQDLQAILQQLERPTLMRKVDTLQTIAQLWNPKTHVRNVIGNELFYRMERLNKYVATPIDWARSKLTGGERTVTFRRNNQGQFWKNFMTGAKAGYRGVNPEGLTTQFDLKSQTFKSKWNPLTYFEKTLGASLKGFDYAAYKRAYNETLGELATLRAINEGQGRNKDLIAKFIREADDNILAIADEYGRYVTFQDNNLVSRGLQTTKTALNKITTWSTDFGLGSMVLKYPKTPGALLMRALEYSPAGFIRSLSIISEPLFRKGAQVSTREVANSISRALTGSGVIGIAYFLTDVGILSGESSSDKDIRSLQNSAGQGAYKVNISALKRFILSGFDRSAAKLQEGDQMYSYDWAQPIAFSIAMGSNATQSVRDKESKGKALTGFVSTGFDNLASGVDTLTGQSVLSGLKNFAEGYPGQTVTDKITSVLSDMPASFAPSILNQANQLRDNTSRETYDPSLTQQSLNKLKARVPGLAQQLPARFDTLGHQQERYQNNSNNLFNVMFNPGFASKYKLTPEAKFVVELIEKTGDTSIAPRVPGKTMTVKTGDKHSQNIKLTPKQYTKLQQLTGEFTRKGISRINPNASVDAQLRKMAKVLNDAGDRARKELKKEITK